MCSNGFFLSVSGSAGMHDPSSRVPSLQRERQALVREQIEVDAAALKRPDDARGLAREQLCGGAPARARPAPMNTSHAPPAPVAGVPSPFAFDRPRVLRVS